MRDPWKRHDQLAPQSECVCAAADCLEDASAHAMRSRIDRAYDFLVRRFLPNARDEELLRQRMAGRDHRLLSGDRELEEIEALTQRLGALKAKAARRDSAATVREIRRVLYGIAALLDIHYGRVMTADPPA
jgi:hypothetical protein